MFFYLPLLLLEAVEAMDVTRVTSCFYDLKVHFWWPIKCLLWLKSGSNTLYLRDKLAEATKKHRNRLKSPIIPILSDILYLVASDSQNYSDHE